MLKTENGCAMRIYATYARSLAQVCRPLRTLVTAIYRGSSRVVFDVRYPGALDLCLKFVEDVSDLTISSLRAFELGVGWTRDHEPDYTSLTLAIDRGQEEMRIHYDVMPCPWEWHRLQDCGAHLKWTLVPAIAAKMPEKKSKILTKDDLRLLLAMASSVEMPKRDTFRS